MQKSRRSTDQSPRRTGLVVGALAALLMAGCSTPARSQPDEAKTTEKTVETAEKTRPSIPESDLVLWLYPDADKLQVADGSVAEWKDSSGYGNDLIAPGESFRPTLDEQAIGEKPALRFDGQDDMLLRDGFTPQRLPEATIFLVAAPSASAGKFDGLISAGNRGAEDSFTGFNVDLGGKNFRGCADTYPDRTSAFTTLNVQSAKTTVDCGQDLLDADVPFARPVIITVHIDADETSVRLDGKPQQAAAGGPDLLTVPQMRLGARFHRQKYQGFYDGAISEVIVYQRSLPEAEVAQVEAYLADWYGVSLGE